MRIGQTQLFLGNLEGARDEFLRCVERARAIAAANPAAAPAKRDIYLMLDRLATVTGHPDHPNLGDPSAAAELYVQAVEQAERVSAADPRDVRARREVAEMRASYAATLRASAPARARDEYTKTLEIYRTLPEALTKTPSVARWIAEHERGLAVSQAAMSRMDLAVPHLRRALVEFERLGTPQQAGIALTDLAQWRLEAGELREARDAGERAVAALEGAWKEHPDHIALRRDLAAAYGVMAGIEAKSRACDARRKWIERSETLWRDVAATEAAAYAARELKKVAAAAPAPAACGAG